MARPYLREFVRAKAENRPGVYRMLGQDGRILYVGKSIRVRTRLLSYFRASPGEKPHELMEATREIAWDYIPDEFGSLVREMKLIQRWRPRFNVQHKRKRRYAFVKITREPAPRLIPVTRVVEDGSRYYGPFPAVMRLAEAVRDLAQVLGLRDCPGPTPVFFSDQLEIFDLPRTPLCLRADLGTCLAPCAGWSTSTDYAERLQVAERFLQGLSDEPFTVVDGRMREAARRLEFEYAARLRDRGERLRQFREHLTAFRGHVESLSFVYRVEGYEGGELLYLIRKGRIRKVLAKPRRKRDRERVNRAVREVFSGPDLAPSSLEPDEAAEILLIARWFRMNPTERRRTVKPERWLGTGSRRGRSNGKGRARARSNGATARA